MIIVKGEKPHIKEHTNKHKGKLEWKMFYHTIAYNFIAKDTYINQACVTTKQGTKTQLSGYI